jgi:hypothetical protein
MHIRTKEQVRKEGLSLAATTTGCRLHGHDNIFVFASEAKQSIVMAALWIASSLRSSQ